MIMMESSGQDLFDLLPDDVVLSIFNKLHDAKYLCLSMSVCKRFHSIAPQVVDIYLPVPHKRASSAVKVPDQENHKSYFRNLVARTLMKPFRFISRVIVFKAKNEEKDLDFYSHRVPNQILKPFEQIRALHLKLPCSGYQKPGSRTGRNTALLKWKADFGREMHSCVIIGARSWSERIDGKDDGMGIDPQESRFLRDDELRLRIVWTISCLIAASARHYLVQEMVKALEKIESVEVSDESGQGRVCMNKEEILDMKGMKGKLEDGQVWEYRSKMPASRMKMWYLERVEVGGKVMEGGTLVVIRAGGCGGGCVVRSDMDMVEGAFGAEREGKILDEAVGKLMVVEKCYSLEMNSF